MQAQKVLTMIRWTTVAAFLLAAPLLQVQAAPARLPSGGVIYDQITGSVSNNRIMSDYYSASMWTQAADDFVVPSNVNYWEISAVEVGGGYNLGPDHNVLAMSVIFYTNAGGLPGGLATPVQSVASARIDNITAASGNYVINLNSAVQLTPGTYWVSVQAVENVNQNWMWSTRNALTNQRSLWNAGTWDSYTCMNTWMARLDCDAYGAPDPDLQFRLWGIISRPTLGGVPDNVKVYYSIPDDQIYPPQIFIRPQHLGTANPFNWTRSSTGSWFTISGDASGTTPNSGFVITPVDASANASGQVVVTVTSPPDIWNSPKTLTLSMQRVNWSFNFINLPIISR